MSSGPSEKEQLLPSRIVHLDLKGAPLNMSYIEKILPILKKWGCNGILMEYEDMFPYESDLNILAASHAYSKEEIEHILKISDSLGMNFIPLIQTFGHFEFVLKHTQFSALREVERYPMALCPSNPDSLQLVYKMLDQVMKLHPTITHFHIGCDEVFHLGLCDKCKSRMNQEAIGRDQLFFAHIKRVAGYLRDKYPQLITCIVWDDMFRHADLSAIMNSDLGDTVEPMVWHYQPTFQLPASIWDNLSAVFPNIWIASAFKGATGPSAMVTNLHFHLDNHNTWFYVLKMIRHKFKSIRGIALTGWQRYDHYAVLCELFPQGLPSLAVCLKFVQQGILTPDDVGSIAKDMNFTAEIPFDPLLCPTIPLCNFPGSSVYQLIIESAHLQRACIDLFNSDGVSGWMNEFNVQRNFINPVHIEPLYTRAVGLLECCCSINGRLGPAFSDVFVPGVLEEWRGCFLEPLLSKIEQFVSKAKTFIGNG
ncbi:hexosaminidase d-like [Plakobranchus ocellatus]|uniref:beta-N-acetylhexosaminidase n=1 Tax=Plakobranchus ocellatus TaxID=259542 RepID=A0AAV3Z9N0_9GAST|nr:hexosaminidase d-like [Plakobranchus ocellatus]